MMNPEQAAAETVESFLERVRSGDVDGARALFSSEVEQLPLPEAGENQTLTWTIGDARVEGETVVVPVELFLASPDVQGRQGIGFVCVQTDAGTRIDMDLTLKETFGASPDELVGAMKPIIEEQEGREETIAPTAAGVEEETLDPELYDPGRLSPEVSANWQKVDEKLGREIESIMGSLESGRDDLWEIALGSMPRDEACPNRFLKSVLKPLADALTHLQYTSRMDPDEPPGICMKEVRAKIRKIRILNVSDQRQCGCTLRDGRLTLKPCLTAGDHPSIPVKGFEAREIEGAIRDALDLGMSASIRLSEAAVAGFVARCRENVDFEPEVTVDWRSFKAIGDMGKTQAALKRFRCDLLDALCHALSKANRKVMAVSELRSIHFEHVLHPDEQFTELEGRRLSFFVSLVEGDPYIERDNLERTLSRLLEHFQPSPAEPQETEASAPVDVPGAEDESTPEPAGEAAGREGKATLPPAAEPSPGPGETRDPLAEFYAKRSGKVRRPGLTAFLGGPDATRPEGAEVLEGEAPVDPGLFQPSRATDDFWRGMRWVEDELDFCVEQCMKRLANENLAWEVAWGTLPGDENCPRRLVQSVVRPLHSALVSLEGYPSDYSGDAAERSFAKVREGIRRIRILNVNKESRCGCRLRDGRLSLQACLKMGKSSSTPVRGFESDEIEWAIRDALDLDVGEAIQQAERAVIAFLDDCCRDCGIDLAATVDWDSFRAIGNGREILAVLKDFGLRLLPSIHTCLMTLNREIPLAGRLESFRFQLVDGLRKRSVKVEGNQVVFRFPLAEPNLIYSYDEMRQIMERLAREWPAPPNAPPGPAKGPAAKETPPPVTQGEPGPEGEKALAGEEKPAGFDFQYTIDSMESSVLPAMRSQMTEQYGKAFGMEVDWDSLEGDPDHFALAVSSVLGTVMGALMTLVNDRAAKGPLVAAVGALRVRYDARVRGAVLELADGVLTATCGGPASGYAPDFEAVLERIRTLSGAETGPAAGVAPPVDEDLAAKYFQLVVDTMESKMLQQLRRQLSDLFGRDFAVEVDWDSLGKDSDHLQRLCSEVVGSVTGALMTLAHDKALKGQLIAAVGAVRFRYDNGVKGETLELADGVLTVACGGPANEYPVDFAAMTEKVKDLLK
ncbi:MAG: hypothetical protein KA419_06520 [Acidobacteria bacterium]|nr:hypothetical protein [Acidobacteriota bacterium]